MILTKYKYTKSLFLNTLKYNHLPKKIKEIKKNNVFFLNTRLARIFIFKKFRAFTVVMLKNLVFITSKS